MENINEMSQMSKKRYSVKTETQREISQNTDQKRHRIWIFSSCHITKHKIYFISTTEDNERNSGPI